MDELVCVIVETVKGMVVSDPVSPTSNDIIQAYKTLNSFDSTDGFTLTVDGVKRYFNGNYIVSIWLQEARIEPTFFEKIAMFINRRKK